MYIRTIKRLLLLMMWHLDSYLIIKSWIFNFAFFCRVWKENQFPQIPILLIRAEWQVPFILSSEHKREWKRLFYNNILKQTFSRLQQREWKGSTNHWMKNAWIRFCIFPYTVFVCLYMEIICPNTVKYETVFRRLSLCECSTDLKLSARKCMVNVCHQMYIYLKKCSDIKAQQKTIFLP